MKKIFIFFFLQFYAFCCLGDSLVFFSPSLECKNHILKLINNSKDSIDIAIYSFTDQDIADALETAHNKGIKIRIISDRQQTMNKNSQIYSLYASGIPVKINTINKLEHNKFIIVDKDIIGTGSFNWTKNASFVNSENCLFLWNDKQTLKKYIQHYEHLWKIITSEKWFKKAF